MNPSMVVRRPTMQTIGSVAVQRDPAPPACSRCATAYLMLHDLRLTLAVVFVKPKMDKLAILKRLLSAVRAAEITIKCLYADKGFCCIEVLRYLKRRALP